MICRAAQQELSLGSDVSPEVQRHLDRCEGCRRFAEDLRAFRTLAGSPVPTPAPVREQTLDRCRAMLAERTATGRTSVRERFRRFCDSPRFAAITATLSVLIVVVMTVVHVDGTGDHRTSFFMKLTIVQLLAQNVSAALFLPALLTLKNRFGKRPSYAPW
jgi:hypothetical protein